MGQPRDLLVAGVFNLSPLSQFPGEYLCQFLVTSKSIFPARLNIYSILIRNTYKIY